MSTTTIAKPTKPKYRMRAGTTGWTVDDLDDPRYAGEWEERRIEIIEGVIAKMPPPAYEGASALDELIYIVKAHLRKQDRGAKFAPECDLVINEQTIPKVDALYLTSAQRAEQRRRYSMKVNKQPGWRYGRVEVVPELIIESVSPGHERHDRITKYKLYQSFGVPNYWLLNARKQTLDVYRLDDGAYVLDCKGKQNDVLKPAAFSGLLIELNELWRDD